MKIYVSHSTSFDYRTELYLPLKMHFNEHELFMPHEINDEAIDTKELLKNSDLILAEVSYPSTGQGVELGWANDAAVPIICAHRNDRSPSSALKIVSDRFINYSTVDEFIENLKKILKSY